MIKRWRLIGVIRVIRGHKVSSFQGVAKRHERLLSGNKVVFISTGRLSSTMGAVPPNRSPALSTQP
jgi:hypothetical protein